MTVERGALRVVHILSAGHSGSTVLDLFLGSARDAFSLGEIVNLPKVWAANERCSCGEALQSCSVWAKAHELAPDAFTGAPLGPPTGQHGIRTPSAWVHRYRELLETLSNLTGARTFIDSSKSPRRMAGLADLPFEQRIIHILRSPRGLLASNRKPTYKLRLPDGRWVDRPRTVQPPQRVLLGMAKQAPAIPIAAAVTRSPYRILRFRDIRSGNPEALAELTQWAGLDYEPAMLTFGNGDRHLVDGNSSRFNADRIGQPR